MRGTVVVLLAGIVAGCAGGASAPLPRTFDLGVEAPAGQVPAVRVAAVRAVAPFDGVEMHYRLAWRNAAELAVFAHSRWAAPPAELLRKQLLRATREGNAQCGLELELQEFSQVFASPGASEARIEFRAALVGPKGRVASRGWKLTEAQAGADAASGAGAFARAADKAVAEIAGWVTAQADCR
jgi:cholesterol transport system auxiliary component